MVKLVPYNDSFETATLNRISEFFGFHHALVPMTDLEISRINTPDDDGIVTLAEWQNHPSALFVVLCGDISVGFIRINYRGPNVAWIEDVFVDAEHRGRGIASTAITAVETIVMNTPGYTAVCLDVSLRNETALRLYHKLGYVDLSLITVRKELGDSKRDKPIKLLDLDFNF
jgi:ribosomal protein S18 acetylase RimI-like enzyme